MFILSYKVSIFIKGRMLLASWSLKTARSSLLIECV